MVVQRMLERLRRSDRGATVAEYALMIGSIAVAMVVATYTLGEDLSDEWLELASFVNGLGSGA